MTTTTTTASANGGVSRSQYDNNSSNDENSQKQQFMNMASQDSVAVVYDRSLIYTAHGEYQFEELRAMLPKYQIVFKPVNIFGDDVQVNLRNNNDNRLFVHEDENHMDIESDSDNDENNYGSSSDDDDALDRRQSKRPRLQDEHIIIHSRMEDENIIDRSRVAVQQTAPPTRAPPVLQQPSAAQQQQQTVPSSSSSMPRPSSTTNNTSTTTANNLPKQARSRMSEVTLFTKDAFNEINSMFCGSLDTTEEIFFEEKKQRREQRAAVAPAPAPPVVPTHQTSEPLFQIHEDNTQDIQQAMASSKPAPTDRRPTVPDKENAPVRQLKQVASRRPSTANTSDNNFKLPNVVSRRVSQAPPAATALAPPRLSSVRRLSIVQQQQLALQRRSSRVSLAPGDVYLDDDLNDSLYLDTDTLQFNHDLSETINFNDVMRGKDAVLGAVPLLQQALVKQTRQSKSNTVNPYDASVMEELQRYLITPYAENDRRFSDERSKKEPTIPDNDKSVIQLGTREYIINGMLGEGAYASVYAATQQQMDGRLSEVFAIKVQSPSWPWEFYICDQLQRRADVIYSEKFIKAWRMFLYDKKSFLVLPYSGYGTLLDVINARITANKAMEEVMVMYYTIELLKIVNEMHSCQIIHGDIKPDNFLIMNEDSGASEEWKREGSPSWSNRGLILIDFGRSIDMSLYPKGTKFYGDHGASSFKCIEMQTGRPWTYQADLYGICGVVHTMLFNKYMEVEQRTNPTTGTSTWTIKEKFKRYHSKLWQEFFDALLNVENCDKDSMPKLSEFQHKFEDFIVEKKWERLIRGLWAKQFISQ